MTGDVVAKVQKLLALAASTNSHDERDSAIGKAYELMLKDSIDEKLVTGGDLNHGDVGETSLVMPTGIYQRPFRQLLVVVAEANHCQVLWISGSAILGRVPKAYIIGFATDRSHVEILHSSLLWQLGRSLRDPNVVAERNREPSNRRAAWNAHFALAYTNRVAERLAVASEVSQEQAEAEHGVQAVAVVLRKVDAAVDDWVKAHHNPTAGRATESNFHSPSAWTAGGAAGSYADIGQARVPSTHRGVPPGGRL